MPPVQRGTRKAGGIILSAKKASAGTIGKCKAVYITGVEANGITNAMIDNDTIAVGARLEDSNATGIYQSFPHGTEDNNSAADSGAAYIYARSGSTWSKQVKLLASDGEFGEWFGNSVSLDGETALVGAFKDDYNDESGSIYIYEKSLHWQDDNTTEGIKRILKRLSHYRVERLVMEATGRYEFSLAEAAHLS